MQPAERLTAAGTLTRNMSGNLDWSGVSRGGPNGLFMVMVALYWWLHRVDGSEQLEKFDALADDVNWVFLTILKSVANSAKRPAPEPDVEEHSQKRR